MSHCATAPKQPAETAYQSSKARTGNGSRGVIYTDELNMEILLDSVSGNEDPAKFTVRVRYLGMGPEPPAHGLDNVKTDLSSAGENKSGAEKSMIIIRRPYSFLEPVITSMFESRKDVRVIVDRRFQDRRQTIDDSPPVERRHGLKDRRRSSPMLDILISVDG